MPSMTEGIPPMRPMRPSPEPRRRWGLIAALSVVVVSGVLFVALLVTFFVVYAGHDRIELIEDEEIFAAIKVPCAHLREVEKERPVTGSEEQRAGDLLTQVAAGERIVKAMDALDKELVESDYPTADWTEDWRILLSAVGTYATKMKSGEQAVFNMPLTEDGLSIVGRMDWASEPACRVPKSFSALDPMAKLPDELKSSL